MNTTYGLHLGGAPEPQRRGDDVREQAEDLD